MLEVWIYSIVSVVLISLISLVGVFTLAFKIDKLKSVIIYLVAFSAGALLGGAFLHLFPEIVEKEGFDYGMGLFVLCGIILFFIVEKFIHWHHCHDVECEHIHAFAFMNLIGDGVHNFLDGLVIAGSYLASIPLGIATTLAVVFHEIPQEIGDFGVLIHGGFSRLRAIMWNFISALFAVFGAIIALFASQYIENLEFYLIPLAVGGFIYIAAVDLIPELHRERGIKKSLIQLASLFFGIFVMWLLLRFG
jgi:zinc and cadmium transporter